jgi:hypothetical protein
MGRLLHALRTCGAALVAQCLGRYAPTCPDGNHDDRVVRGYLFNCLQLAESVLGTRGSSEAALSQKVGVEAQVTRSGPGAAPRRELEPRGYVAASELPRVGRREPEPWGHVAALELPRVGRREPLS